MRFALSALLCLLASAPALAQNAGNYPIPPAMLQTDANGVPVPPFLRMWSTHQVTLAASAGSRNIDALNEAARFVMVTCTVACTIAQKQSPATANSNTDFLLPANVILYLRVQQSDSIAFKATTSGTAFVTELY